MKKTLLTILTAGALLSANAQVPSPAWATLQNTNYTLAASFSSKFLDVINSNVVWSIGYSGANVSQNFVNFSRTINGGTTFNTGAVYASTLNPAVGDTNTYVIANLDAIDANTAWVSAYLKGPGAQGAIHRTIDGGATWQNMTAPGMFTNSASFCNVVAFLTPSIGVAQGDGHPGNANEYEIWRTNNGGTTWTIVPGANIPNPTSGEYFLVNVYEKQGTTNLWFGTNKGRVFRSIDAGLTWSVSVLPSAPSASISVSDIAFCNANMGICTAFNTSVTPGVFEQFITSDGGATWTKVTSIDPNFGRNDVAGVPGTNVFVSAANSTTATSGFLSYSSDGGLTWTNWGCSAIPYLAIDFSDATSGWAATFQTSQTAPTGGIYKFNGATSIFNAPSAVCFTSPSTTVNPINWSLGNSTVTYSWSVSPAATISAPTATNPTLTFTAPGNYVVTLAATNSSASSSSSRTINVTACSTPTADFTVPSGTLCNNVALNFTNVTTGTPTPTYTWSTIPAAGVTISPNANATSPAITFSAGGTYTVNLLASSVAGSVVVSKTITVNSCTASPSFSIPAALCSTAIVTPNNSTTGPGPISYTWSTAPSSSVAFAPNAVAASPSITISGIGVYTITLRAGNASGVSITTRTIDVQNCVGINETKFANLTDVSPNPTNGNLNITLPTNGDYNLVVVDVLGSVIVSEKIINSNIANINLAGKAKGVYFVTVSNKVDKVTKKIVLE
jgi:photosystem II stability/assembly factor-like uncharacterized protein